MSEPKFSHCYHQDAYDKAMLKYDKMVETESGKKFFAHLVKSFIQSGTDKKVEDSEERKGVLTCDLTKFKVVTVTSFNSFKGIYNAKMAGFEKNEDETDEQFENRRAAYIEAFKSSNPYACNADLAYTAEKTDKVLCIEAIDALAAKFNAIKDDPKYSDLMKLIEIKVHHQKVVKKNQKSQENKGHKSKVKFVKSSSNSKPSGHVLGDNEVLKKMKENMES